MTNMQIGCDIREPSQADLEQARLVLAKRWKGGGYKEVITHRDGGVVSVDWISVDKEITANG